jgi:hypothetical protein
VTIVVLAETSGLAGVAAREQAPPNTGSAATAM